VPGNGQTDFSYFKIIGWGWYYLSTVLDDYSRYIIAWKLCTNMRAEDVTDTIKLALRASGCDQAVVRHKPRLLRDNGSCYILGAFAEWLVGQKIKHIRGAPLHTQTQGRIPSRGLKANRCRAAEHWHKTLKNRILLENHYVPGDLERQIWAFIEYYIDQQYHESLNNVTPADVYLGRDKAILRERERIKKHTIRRRRLQHQKKVALTITQTNLSLQCSNRSESPFYLTTDNARSALTGEILPQPLVNEAGVTIQLRPLDLRPAPIAGRH
jgi:putative transposase